MHEAFIDIKYREDYVIFKYLKNIRDILQKLDGRKNIYTQSMRLCKYEIWNESI